MLRQLSKWLNRDATMFKQLAGSAESCWKTAPREHKLGLSSLWRLAVRLHSFTIMSFRQAA
jgi:hypothetical protein